MNDVCVQMQELIPWLINRTLNSSERVSVYQHVATCGHCRNELVFFMELNKKVEKLSVTMELNKQFTEDLFTKIKTQIHTDQFEESEVSNLKVQLQNNKILNPFDAVNHIFKTLTTTYKGEFSQLTKSLDPILRNH
ncbi:zf-HC2 domain-containing protein [Chengkuizengella marina]|uniref:Zf-HC2 domain-containing protein n=1 Tax=Chengkuizengella marina TaxID=2507566 RepID=A0A6N9Q659_9BACL|nr:zf-HC2 domain-containing protein [Chengkuizengella marina]NBI30181.1 zf-HC2 domain-containing protein [Chengkuizengella marina]